METPQFAGLVKSGNTDNFVITANTNWVQLLKYTAY